MTTPWKPRLVPEAPAMVSSPVWNYGGHRLSFCYPELLFVTGCPDYSMCIPPAFSVLQWPARDIADLRAVLADLSNRGVTNVRVVIGVEGGVVKELQDLQRMLDPLS